MEGSAIPLILWYVHLMNPSLFRWNLSSSSKTSYILTVFPLSSAFCIPADLTYLSLIFVLWNSTNTCVIGFAKQSIVYSTSFIPVALIEFSNTAFTSSSLLSSLKPCTTALHSIGTFRGSSFEFSSRHAFFVCPWLVLFRELFVNLRINVFFYSLNSCFCSFVSSANVFIDPYEEFFGFFVFFGIRRLSLWMHRTFCSCWLWLPPSRISSRSLFFEFWDVILTIF